MRRLVLIALALKALSLSAIDQPSQTFLECLGEVIDVSILQQRHMISGRIYYFQSFAEQSTPSHVCKMFVSICFLSAEQNPDGFEFSASV